MIAWVALLLYGAGKAPAHAVRTIPVPLSGHPGNIFLEGERVKIPVPEAQTWILEDYDGRRLTIAAANGSLDAGQLPTGFYRLRHQGQESNRYISVGVVSRLKAPTPLTSPIAIDTAAAWFYPDPQQIARVASLCTLAGVNRVRDRMAWGEIETGKNMFAPHTRYDASLKILSDAGLQVLDVNHQTPAWAARDMQHFPPDLRDIYGFYREIAARWKGQLNAIEPWNEADIEGFGGQTGCEMAALQKACYLALKAGNPNLNVCMNVWAQHVKSKLADFQENAAWPYFDTYDLHHYEEFAAYPKLYADHRAVSAGRPMWVTECSLPVRWSGDAALQEPSEIDLKVQAERLPKVYACAIHEGVTSAYYFILGNYAEGQTQFGILRKDLTPRPAYVALAAAGRLLADAHAAGRLKLPEGNSGYLFDTAVDGMPRKVAVFWCDDAAKSAPVSLPAQPLAAFDCLGRPLPVSRQITPATAPEYVVFTRDTAVPTEMVQPPAPAQRLAGEPGKVVLQPLWERSRTALARSACRVSLSHPIDFSVYAYNFGNTAVEGAISADIVGGWHVSGGGGLKLAPMERRLVLLHIVPGDPGATGYVRLRIAGDFGKGEHPSASVRLVPENTELAERSGPAAAEADPSAWDLMIPNGPKPTAERVGNALVFAAAPSGDPWFYPKFRLVAGHPVPKDAIGIACTITVLEGDANFKFIYDEANGASYVSDAAIAPERGRSVKTLGLFTDAVHGDGWSAPDPRGELDPTQVIAFKIGCNAKRDGPIKFKVSDIRWIIGTKESR
jgi:hypothetical protein